MAQEIDNPEEIGDKASDDEKIEITMHNENTMYTTGTYMMNPEQISAVMPLFTTIVGPKRVTAALNGDGKEFNNKKSNWITKYHKNSF